VDGAVSERVAVTVSSRRRGSQNSLDSRVGVGVVAVHVYLERKTLAILNATKEFIAGA
jgi:hypothetical protein